MRIAVVIPVRDDAAALEQCLTAIEDQTRQADDIVVVDNGSTDGSAGVAARHGARVVTARVPGIPGATATGFDHARGDVLARLDADSVAPADWLARIGTAFTEDPELAAVSGAATFYGGPGVVRVLGRLSLTVGYFRVIAGLLGHAPLYGSNFAITAALWQRIAPAVHRDRGDVHDDLDLSLHLPPGVRVRYDPALAMAVSARSFRRPGGTGRQLRFTAATLAAAQREDGLLRMRFAWYLATGRPGPGSAPLFRGLEQREQIAAQRVWGRLAGAVAAGVDVEGRAELVGEASMQVDGPDVVVADGDQDGDAAGPESFPDVGHATQ